jgi:hypothetical protein
MICPAKLLSQQRLTGAVITARHDHAALQRPEAQSAKLARSRRQSPSRALHYPLTERGSCCSIVPIIDIASLARAHIFPGNWSGA